MRKVKDVHCALLSLINLHLLRSFFQRLFDSHISIPDISRYHPDFYVDYDYSIIAKESSNYKQESITENLINSAQEKFLSHPLVETFISVKWKKIKYPFYYKFFSFFIFLILQSVYLILAFGGSPVWLENKLTENLMRGLHICMIILSFIILIPDLLYFSFNKVKYLQQWETYSKFIAMFGSLYVLFSPTITSDKTEHPMDIQIAAITAFLNWTEFMMLLGRFPIKGLPSLGIYIMMLTQVANSTIKFIVAFMSLLIGFSVSFYIIFTDVEDFNTFPRSFMKTLMMIVNGFDNWPIQKPDRESLNISFINAGGFENWFILTSENLSSMDIILSEVNGFESGSVLSPDSKSSINITSIDKNIISGLDSEMYTEILQNIFLLLYAFMVSILMANLLIGLATDDIPELNRQGKIRRLAKQATYLMSYENILENLIDLHFIPKYFKDKFKKHAQYFFIHNNNIHPNRKRSRNVNQIKTIQNAINLKTDEQVEDTNEDLKNLFIKFSSRYKKDQSIVKEDQSIIKEHLKSLSEELSNLRNLIKSN